MKICSNKDIKVITAVMAASMLLGGCTSTVKPTSQDSGVSLKPDPEIKTEIDLNKIPDTDFDQDVMDSEYRRYCFDLFSQTIKDYGGEGNVMISPASIMMALDMVAAGAKENSLKQLTDLFAAGQGPLTQQAYAAALMDKINGAKDVDFSCANAVWNNAALLGDKVNAEYVDYIKETFLAEYTVTAFDENTPGEINNWVYEHTDHMIEKVIDRLDPLTVMVLVNAISFDGKWAEPYEEDQVNEGMFNAADGSEQEAMFLSDNSHAYYETDKATGFIKEYEGGEYAFLAILPTDESVSANDFAVNFTPADYEEFINSVTYEYEVYSRMPEFKSDFDILLNDTIKNLGAGDIFDDQKADFTGIAGNPGDIYVSRIIHKTHIEVDSKGTKAAAVTAITLRTKGAVMSDTEVKIVNCNRPFVYAIVDTETMAPVFIGTVNKV
ncbi:MAG: serpin family protein [Saccharofermentans sp.]|nr:serpin family protein [Saccharofermentans sp.]